MEITPDNIIYWQWEGFHLNATIISTWLVMLVLLLISWLATRNLVMRPKISRWQVSLEVVIGFIREQIKEITQQNPDPFIPFLGSLFLFISISNLLDIIPGFRPPTGSLSTTTASDILCFRIPESFSMISPLSFLISVVFALSLFISAFNSNAPD